MVRRPPRLYGGWQRAGMSTPRLVTILDALASGFPHLERVGSYANAPRHPGQEPGRSGAALSQRIADHLPGSGAASDDVLRRIGKGQQPAEMTQAVAQGKSGWAGRFVIGILGALVQSYRSSTPEATGTGGQRDGPSLFLYATLMLVPGNGTASQWLSGAFQLMEPEEMLGELRQVISHLQGLSHWRFRTNHAPTICHWGERSPGQGAPVADAGCGAAAGRTVCGPRPGAPL